MIPKWISIVSSLIAILVSFVGCSLYFFPAKFVPGVDFSSSQIVFLANMWAARQISTAAIIAFSVFRQSAQMLTISLLGFCIINFQDIFIGYSKSDLGLMAGASFFTAISSIMIYFLRKKSGLKI